MLDRDETYRDETYRKEAEVVIEPYGALPCSLKVFTINGKDAEISDFGHMEDTESIDAEPWSCKYMHFIPYEDEEYEEHMIQCRKYYCITEYEYNRISDMLEAKLLVGECGWCV